MHRDPYNTPRHRVVKTRMLSIPAAISATMMLRHVPTRIDKFHTSG